MTTLNASGILRRTGAAVVVAALVGGLAGIRSAAAQDSDELAVEVGDCVDLDSPAERFACYENRVDAALRERSRTAEPAAEPERRSFGAPPALQRAKDELASAADRPSLARDNGIGEDEATRAEDAARALRRGGSLGAAEARLDEDDREELVATIASLQETVPNSYLITLENGQVWRQMRPKRYALQPGHAVRIYPTTWGGSYRLTVDELRSFIQVERVR